MMEKDCLPKSAYNMLCNLCECRKKNWVSMVKDILFRYYYYYYYYVFILSAISPYTTGLKALFNQSDCTGTAPTDK